VKWFFGISVAWLLALGGISAAPPVIQGQGLCRFVLHDYPLPKANEDKINFIIADLLKRHEEAFGFTNDPDFRVRIRIFGRFEDYRKFALTNSANIETATSISNLAGYYSGRDQEVVTWRQRDPTYLANNILHECSHAIMHHQFRALPLWLDEGCAVYFQYPAFMRGEAARQRLQGQWYQLKQWNDEKSLPDLRTFLNLSPEQFRALDPARSYLTGWSIFQLLMSTSERRRALNAMILEYQQPAPTPPDCAQLLNRFYPGGLARMEKDWRLWIAGGAANVLGAKTGAGN
jgi:hypothetical protein